METAEVVSQGLTLLEKLAAKLGVGADMLWQTLCRQAVVEAIVYIPICIIVPIAYGFFLRWFIQRSSEDGYWDYDNDTTVKITSIIISAGGGLGTIIALRCLPIQIINYFNPEFYAVQEIIKCLGTIR